MFMNSLDKSMNAMTNTFYSSPPSSGSSGGSFSGGVDFPAEVLVAVAVAVGRKQLC